MDKLLQNALDALSPSECTREEWLKVGMALKHEGCSAADWDLWSRNDSRYHSGECERLWNGFHGGGSSPVTAGTIVQLAKEHGWIPETFDRMATLDWDDVISYDGDEFDNYHADEHWEPAQELITYLRTLFHDDEYVGYVVHEAFQREGEDKWFPSKGVFHKTAAELIAGIEAHPEDLGYTFGDPRPGSGAWIRFNPLDGKGVGNSNVTRFTYALVESDTVSVPEQEFIYKKLELPIATLVYSGGKSLHAIVKVEAKDAAEYQKRVAFLYDYLAKQGVEIDKQNSNPSRLSRMPGFMRGEKRQYLVGTNIGRKSWADWMDFVEGEADELPEIEDVPMTRDDFPPPPEPLIDGILRKGHKMLIAGPSKAGKSFLLMELAVALAHGAHWLGFQCKPCKVLYINFEIDSSSFKERLLNIYDAMLPNAKDRSNLKIWNLRGYAKPLPELVPIINRKIRNGNFGAIIFDPIYKIISGDENNASEMGEFCNQFDKICHETGAAAIYCHHHSKGAQGGKKAADRASGSGVFSRDPDAQLDITPLELTQDYYNNVADDNAPAFRMESSLREFRNIDPVDFWFRYPIHEVDDAGILTQYHEEGSALGNLSKSSKRVSEDDRANSIRMAYEACAMNPPVTVKAMADYLAITEKTARVRIKELQEEFWIAQGVVGKVKNVE